jgi:hypothetical protein
MKKFTSKVQDLSQKAANLRAAAQRAPAQVRELRETVLATAGEFQQLRGDVQSAVSGLRLDSEEQLTRALAELEDGREIIREAGYDFTGVDLELHPVQRLIVHLEKFEDVSEAGLELLLASIAARKTVHAVLAALIRAEQLADRVSLTELTYRELTIYVGPVPTVRLCWRPTETAEEAIPVEATAPKAPVAPPQPPPLPGFGESSFFAPRPAAPAPATSAVMDRPVVVMTPQPAPAPAVAQTAPEVAPKDWKTGALDRFKKMPNLGPR